MCLPAFLAFAVAVSACKPPPKTVEKPPAIPEAVVKKVTDLESQLADARIDAAKAKLGQKLPDEALALLVSALKANPESGEAKDLAENILRETVWNFPVLTIDHRLPVDRIAIAGRSLWVSLGGKTNTTVRWNLDNLQIGSVMFPAADCATRSMVFDPDHHSVVIERGPVALLCNADTLKPIREVGAPPEYLTPSAAITFSQGGLLLAQPTAASESDPSVVWHLRDSATGEILRSSEPAAGEAPPLAAYLDRKELRVICSDGSLMEMPVSPVEEIRRTPPAEPMKLLRALFSPDGKSALVLRDHGPHEAASSSVISYGGDDDGALTAESLMRRYPWNRQPNIWSGVMEGESPFVVEGNIVKLLTGPHAPVVADSAITAVAFDGTDVLTGGENGVVRFHRLLPAPAFLVNQAPSATPDRESIAAMEALVESLAGLRFDEKERSFDRLPEQARLEAVNRFDPDKLAKVFPQLDFTAVIQNFKETARRRAEPTALVPLWDRLARADLTGKSWPELLKLSEPVADTQWHRDLTAAVRARASGNEGAAEESPWLAPRKLEEAFREGNPDAVIEAIKSAGAKGPAAAHALALALTSEHPEWILASLDQAKDLPPLLREVALSRIAWLQGRKPAALSVWPEDFPKLAEIRLREDWEGWEQADFQPALDNIRQCVTDELTAIEVPENSTPEQRKAIADRLADPETIATVGKARFAQACLKAALAFSAHKEESETTFLLAKTARELGVAPEPCLRAEALALTALGDYEKAHQRWIELITEHPVETTEPGDYAEAAYTAFENADPRQAMEILTTGMHRFPRDGNFALRAGWVALLTGNAERAYQFLQDGKRIGFPAEKVENATALLTIAASQCGADDDAWVYFQELLKIDPAWADPATLDSLDWPEELKASLAQYMRQ